MGHDVSDKTLWVGQIVNRDWFDSPVYAKYRQPGNIKIPFWLQPEKHYIGSAWFRREIQIPASWVGKRIRLMLERVHVNARVWVDGKAFGSDKVCINAIGGSLLRIAKFPNDNWGNERLRLGNAAPGSLSTPHIIDLGHLTPESHVLELRVRTEYDFIYRDVIKKYEDDRIINLHLALSRSDVVPKKYVQHRIVDMGKELATLLTFNQDTHYYVCGDAKMADECFEACISVLRKHSVMSRVAAVEHLKRMQLEGRWHRYVWGIVSHFEDSKRSIEKESGPEQSSGFKGSPKGERSSCSYDSVDKCSRTQLCH